jgi:transcriptional regulator with XRE-family HTH domain
METSTIHPHNAQPDSLQATLQTARKSKRLSQLELALRMGVSQRHVSFVESGRAQPSRELLLNWLHELQAPLALRNVALQQAGFAPVYRGSELADAVLAPVRDALAQLLQAHDPMPAMVMDAAWNVLHMNRGAQWLATTLMPWVAELPPGAPVNMIDAMLHPEGMTRHITNLEEVPDILPRVEQLAQQMQQRLGKRVLAAWPRQMAPVLTTRFATRHGELAFFSMFSTFGTPQDITLASLRVEHVFPADEATRAVLTAQLSQMGS